jgi:hypothetical protein
MLDMKKKITISATWFLICSAPAMAENPPSFGGFNQVLGLSSTSDSQSSSNTKPEEPSESLAAPTPAIPQNASDSSSEDRDSGVKKSSVTKLKIPAPDSQAFQDLRKKMMAAKGQEPSSPDVANKSIHDLTRQELSQMVKDKKEAHIKDRMQSVFNSNRVLSLDSGENRVLPISLGNFNRFVTPFDDPKVYSTCSETDCKSFVESNVVFFATANKQPRGLFISPSDNPSVSISVTVKPDALINPQEYSITVSNYAPQTEEVVISDPGAARDFEGMGQSKYMTWIRKTFDIVARGEIPPGYSVADPDTSMNCRLEGLDTQPGQVLNGARYRIDVYKVTNTQNYVQQVSESACFDEGVKFVFTLPNPKVSPGDSLELFVMRTKPKENFNLRPKLIGNR